MIPAIVKADVMNPEYLTKKCPAGQQEVTCSYESSKPFGPKTSDECVKYQDNPNFEYLVGHGSSFGGSSKYCFVGSGNPEDYSNKNPFIKSDDTEDYSNSNPIVIYKNFLIPTFMVVLILIAGILTLVYVRKRNKSRS